MPAVLRPYRDWPALAAVGLALAVSLAAAWLAPASVPWVLLGMAVGTMLLLWAVRYDAAVAAWMWVLSYGMLDRPLWVWEISGFFNMTIPRLAFLGAVGVLLIHLLSRSQRVRLNRALLWVMGALLIWCAASATVAGWKAQGPLPTAPYFRFLEPMLFPMVIFALVYASTKRERQIPTLLVLLSVYGWYALYIGYLQYAAIIGWEGARQFIFPAYINQPSWGVHYGIHFDRARGAYAMANPQATLLIVVMLADLYLIRRLRGPYRVAAAVQAMLIPPAVFFTGLRSAYLGFLLAGAIWLWWAGKGRLGRLKLVFCAMALAVAAIAFWGNLTGENRATGGMAQKAPVVGRWILAQRAWEVFSAHPLTGAGFGHYIEAEHGLSSDPALLARLGTGLATPHNLFLVMAAETGLVGLALTVALLVLLWRQSRQLYRRLPVAAAGWLSRDFVVLYWGVMAAYLVDAMLVDPLWDAASSGLFWSFSGLVVGFNRMLDPANPQAIPAAPAAVQA